MMRRPSTWLQAQFESQSHFCHPIPQLEVDRTASPATQYLSALLYVNSADLFGHLLVYSSCGTLGKICRDINLAGIESAGETELALDTLDTVSRVDVLDQSDLIASCGSLAGDDRGVGEEEFPNL
jgi:hypothetical protein